MKKYLTLLFALTVLTLSLVGCSNDNAPPETSNSNSTLQEPSSNDNTAAQDADNSPTPEKETSGNIVTEPETENIDTVQQIISGDFAIRNIETGKNIRPYNSGTSDGNDIILYPHNEWKCLTWQFNHVEGTTYQLQNVYTRKTFEPVSDLESGVALWQQPISDNSPQWEFIEQQDGIYAIRLVDTELYISISSDKTDTPIVLMPFENINSQLWELIEQYPTV